MAPLPVVNSLAQVVEQVPASVWQPVYFANHPAKLICRR
jgi:hypothetical protein